MLPVNCTLYARCVLVTLHCANEPTLTTLLPAKCSEFGSINGATQQFRHNTLTKQTHSSKRAGGW